MVRLKTATLVSLLSVAILASLGSTALAWSPLAKDGLQDVEGQNDKTSVIEQMRQQEANSSEEQPDGPEAFQPGNSSKESSEESPRRASTSSSTNDDEDSSGPAREITPKAKKQSGQQPNEETLDPAYFYKRAHSFVKDGDFQSALNYINKALDLSPEYWEAWYEKAMIYQLAGMDGPAARRYKELIRRRPDMVEARIAMGALYRKHQNYDLAEKEYKAAIDVKFSCFEAHYNLANVLFEEDKLEAALKEYKICLKMQPTNALVHNNIGVIYEKRAFLEEAAEEFTRAAHLAPANKIFASNLTHVKSKLGQKPQRAVPM